MSISRLILGFVFLLSASVQLSAQWLHYPTPAIPRTPDGKPNLSAPAPRTADGKPDLSGIWTVTDGKYFQDLGAGGVEIPMLPWAKALYELSQRTLLRGDPLTRCIPPGGPRQFLVPNGFQFIEHIPGGSQAAVRAQCQQAHLRKQTDLSRLAQQVEV